MRQEEIELRSPKEIADLLGVTVTCLIAWRRTGVGPTFTRIGTRKVAYDMQDVKAWLDTQAARRQRCQGVRVNHARTEKCEARHRGNGERASGNRSAC